MKQMIPNVIHGILYSFIQENVEANERTAEHV